MRRPSQYPIHPGSEDVSREMSRIFGRSWAGDCGGKRRIVATIHNPREIERFLRHLKLWPSPDDDLVAIRGPPEDVYPPDEEPEPSVDQVWDDDSWFGPDELPLAA